MNGKSLKLLQPKRKVNLNLMIFFYIYLSKEIEFDISDSTIICQLVKFKLAKKKLFLTLKLKKSICLIK